jgi:hypothetical protein
MQFSDTTNKNGIIQHQEQLTLGDGKISGNTLNLAYFTLSTNNWLMRVGDWIQGVTGEWPFGDINNGSLDVEEYDFTDDQTDYGIDTDIRAILRVRIRDASTEKYSDIAPGYEKDLPDDLFNETKGTPTKYFFMGESILFDPPPDTTKYDKYELTYSRDMHLFLTTDTTAVPGFNKAFHPILVYGPVREWALINSKDGSKNGLVSLCNQMLGDMAEGQNGLKRDLLRFYANRSRRHVNTLNRATPAGGSWK